MTVRQCSPIWENSDGIEVATCGSLPSNGLPVVVRLPAMTQELEPISPFEVRGSSHGRSTAPIWAAGPLVAAAGRPWLEPPVRGASGAGRSWASDAEGSNRPFTTVPRVTIGSKPSSG